MTSSNRLSLTRSLIGNYMLSSPCALRAGLAKLPPERLGGHHICSRTVCLPGGLLFRAAELQELCGIIGNLLGGALGASGAGVIVSTCESDQGREREHLHEDGHLNGKQGVASNADGE